MRYIIKCRKYDTQYHDTSTTPSLAINTNTILKDLKLSFEEHHKINNNRKIRQNILDLNTLSTIRKYVLISFKALPQLSTYFLYSIHSRLS